MSSNPTGGENTPRREFIGQLATAAVALVGTAACAPAIASQQPATSTAPAANGGGARAAAASAIPAAKVTFDDSWTTRLTAPHKGVFDSPEIGDGIAVMQAQIWIRGNKEALGATDADTQAVLVLRHAAVPMVFNDALWEKYELGKETKTKDYRTKKFETRNPWRATLESLQEKGSIVLGCNLAAMGFASRIAERTKQDVEAVRQEIRANLVKGAMLMPSGIYAVHRAQEAGCTYIRSI